MKLEVRKDSDILLYIEREYPVLHWVFVESWFNFTRVKLCFECLNY